MVSPELFQDWIDELEEYREELKEDIKSHPRFRDYTAEDIEIIEQFDKAKPYTKLQKNLFGEYPLEYQVYEVYSEKRREFTYKTTTRRHTAEEFDNLDEKDVRRLVRKYKRKKKRDKMWHAKREIAENKEKVKEVKQKDEKISNHNRKVYSKLYHSKKIQWDLVNKKEDIKLNQGLEATVKIDFRGLPATAFNGEMSGPITFLAKYITRKEFEIARKNDRVEVVAGDLDSALEQCDFRNDKLDRKKEKCSECKRVLDYNQIGVNKKLGRKERSDWLCRDCLDISDKQYRSMIDTYKSGGCNLFV